MAKIILILSIVAMGAAIFLGIKTRKELVTIKTDTITLNQAIEDSYVAAGDVADEATTEAGKVKIQRSTFDDQRVHLLELKALTRLHGVLEGDHRRQRHELALADIPPDVFVLTQLTIPGFVVHEMIE